ncbi:helix-turn-helix domain-containing protein [Phaeacidiphilus oryzae]|uniref:helix-turn-helix domain-containing protein n=1 Tax=Phaeacidiphilus oryzae TaxID=348818 RepID=UPI000564648A|nr:helix-turn-helix transcriptional regulator [Phaeacidiphilus oryzae]
MADELTDFATWLRETAAAAGRDPERRGATAELARISGVDAGQLSRFYNGQAAPSYKSMLKLAPYLGVTADEMARRAGGGEDGLPAGGTASEITPGQALLALGITRPEDQAVVLAVVERLRTYASSSPDA